MIRLKTSQIFRSESSYILRTNGWKFEDRKTQAQRDPKNPKAEFYRFHNMNLNKIKSCIGIMSRNGNSNYSSSENLIPRMAVLHLASVAPNWRRIASVATFATFLEKGLVGEQSSRMNNLHGSKLNFQGTRVPKQQVWRSGIKAVTTTATNMHARHTSGLEDEISSNPSRPTSSSTLSIQPVQFI